MMTCPKCFKCGQPMVPRGAADEWICPCGYRIRASENQGAGQPAETTPKRTVTITLSDAVEASGAPAIRAHMSVTPAPRQSEQPAMSIVAAKVLWMVLEDLIKGSGLDKNAKVLTKPRDIIGVDGEKIGGTN